MVKKTANSKLKKRHPWRMCPSGQHWVITHPRRIHNGMTRVSGYCRSNPSGKDQLYREEFEEIASKHFDKVKLRPKPDNLDFKYRGNKYDVLIAGWTKYWNDVLKPQDNLDPNLVKALIATESSFKTDAIIMAGKRAGYARGLMQVTDWTIEILKDEKGELSDHLINLDQKDMIVANLNIAAGIRWLHRKQGTASAKLKRRASWIEAAADYKSYLGEWQKNPKHKQMNRLITFYDRLKK
jgi:hypothetical protein